MCSYWLNITPSSINRLVRSPFKLFIERKQRIQKVCTAKEKLAVRSFSNWLSEKFWGEGHPQIEREAYVIAQTDDDESSLLCSRSWIIFFIILIALLSWLVLTDRIICKVFGISELRQSFYNLKHCVFSLLVVEQLRKLQF